MVVPRQHAANLNINDKIPLNIMTVTVRYFTRLRH
jgi:hypothetical protein